MLAGPGNIFLPGVLRISVASTSHTFHGKLQWFKTFGVPMSDKSSQHSVLETKMAIFPLQKQLTF